MGKPLPAPVFREARHHSITFEPFNGRDAIKEEVFLYFDATWQGRPVVVTLHADRYTHSEGLSEWRVYASEAREIPAEGQYAGANLTDTARRRLSDACYDDAREWLWSSAYIASAAGAYVRALEHGFYDLRPSYTEPTKRVREDVARWAHKIPDAERARLERLADAYDHFAAIYNEGRES